MHKSSRPAIVGAVVMILLASVYINLFLNKSEARIPRKSLAEFPRNWNGWSGADERMARLDVENLKVDDYLLRRFTRGQDAIWLYIGYYGRRGEGSAPHSPRNCFPGSGWSPLNVAVSSFPVGPRQDRAIRANQYLFGKGDDRQYVVYWYQSQGRAIASEYEDLAYKTLDALVKRRTDGALIRVSASLRAGQDPGDALRGLRDFVSDVYPLLREYVPD